MRGFLKRQCAFFCVCALLLSCGSAKAEFSPAFAALTGSEGLHAEITGRIDVLSPLSDASLERVNAWLSQLKLTMDIGAAQPVSTESADVEFAGERLFAVFIQRMEGGVLTAFSPSGGAYWTLPEKKDALALLAGSDLDWNIPHPTLLRDGYDTLAEPLYALLSEYVSPRTVLDSTSVKNALASASYVNYVFQGDEMNVLWPQALEILLPALRETLAAYPACLAAAERYFNTLSFSGECRFKRLLDKSGGDMGLQFTGQIEAEGLDRRKATLFFGSTPGRGGYFSLSLPAVKGKNTLKFTFGARLTEKENQNTLTFDGSCTHTLDGETASAEWEGSLKNEKKSSGEQWSGKVTLSTSRTGEKAAWTLTPEFQARDGALSGTVTVQKKVGKAVALKGTIQMTLTLSFQAAPLLAVNTADLRGLDEKAARAQVLGEMTPLSRAFLRLMLLLPEEERTLLTHELRTDAWMNGPLAPVSAPETEDDQLGAFIVIEEE